MRLYVFTGTGMAKLETEILKRNEFLNRKKKTQRY